MRASSSAPATTIAAPPSAGALWARRLVATLLILTGLFSLAFSAVSIYAATLVVRHVRNPITSTPGDFGLGFQNVTFPSRGDGLQLKGWLIPGVNTDGSLTLRRTIIMVHGNDGNRADKTINLLNLEVDIAKHGFGVLAFDLRGLGESADAPNSFGYFEYRDVLGAVDFLKSGTLPYPDLGRPQALASWGVSLGGVSSMLAAAQEPAIQALVVDSSYPDMAPILEREIPKQGGLPALLVPGIFLADQVLYGIDFYHVRPADVFGKISPRPIFFIQGDHDDFNPPSNLALLTQDATNAGDPNVSSWQVPGVKVHARTYKTAPEEYVQRVVAFYDAALGS